MNRVVLLNLAIDAQSSGEVPRDRGRFIDEKGRLIFYSIKLKIMHFKHTVAIDSLFSANWCG